MSIVYDSIGAPHYTLNLEEADDKADRQQAERRRTQSPLQEWLVAAGVPEAEIDMADTAAAARNVGNTLRSRRKLSRDDHCQAQLLHPPRTTRSKAC